MNAARILLVEDETNVSFALTFHLQAAGWVVHLAETLADAESALDESIDLLLLDRALPDGDGIHFCEQARARGFLIPILMLTANDSPESIVDGLNAGADDYVTKTARTSEVIGRIHAQLRRYRWSRAAKAGTPVVVPFEGIELNGVRVNFATHRYDGTCEPGELTALEIRLLRHFLENPNRVVSRSELLEHVWGLSGNVHTRTVDNFMMRLRRLFEPDDTAPAVFITVRGSGYRFQQP